MAIEIVGKDESKRKRVTCNNCSSILEYLEQDVESKNYTDYSGVSDTYRSIKCPCCTKIVSVK